MSDVEIAACPECGALLVAGLSCWESILIANVQWHTGEVSCVKGLQGEKGYPF